MAALGASKAAQELLPTVYRRLPRDNHAERVALLEVTDAMLSVYDAGDEANHTSPVVAVAFRRPRTV